METAFVHKSKKENLLQSQNRIKSMLEWQIIQFIQHNLHIEIYKKNTKLVIFKISKFFIFVKITQNDNNSTSKNICTIL
jgi:hypothetical protein